MINLKFDIKSPVAIKGNIQAVPGKITMITGPTGCGKTTLLYRLIYSDTSGIKDYDFNGKQMNASIRDAKIATVFQSDILIKNFTLKQHIELLSTHIEIEAKELMHKLNLNLDLNREAASLSGGEKQRFTIVLALLKHPDLIVMDEPTSALDEENKINMLKVLKEEIIKNNIAVVMTSHDSKTIACGDFHVELENGHIEMNIHEQDTNVHTNVLSPIHAIVYYARNYYHKFIKKELVTFLLIAGIFTILFSIDQVFIQRINRICNDMKVAIIYQYSNTNKQEKNNTAIPDSLENKIIQNDSVQSVQYVSMLLAKGFDVNNEHYEDYITLESFFDVDQVEFISSLNQEGAYINQEYALQYNIKLNDIIKVNGQEYTITALLNNYQPSYETSSGLCLFIPDLESDSHQVMIIHITNTIDIDDTIEQLNKLNHNYSCSLTNYQARFDLDYYKSMYKIERIIKLIIILILSIMLSLYTMRNENEKYKNYAYLISNGINRGIIAIYMIFEKVICFGLIIILLYILNLILFKSKFDFYIYMFVLTGITSIITVIPLYNKKKYFQYLRSEEYKI